MMKRAQTLMVSLWVLAILTILAVGIGHRVSMALRMSRYHRDSFKALELARAGLNLAIAEIEKDTNDYDSPFENWADNERTFKVITLNKNPREYATVSFTFRDEDAFPQTVYGVQDAERKININTASPETLLALLEKSGVAQAQTIVDAILIWRGDWPDEDKMYEKLGYPCKGSVFSKPEELMLVAGFTVEDYLKIKDYITAGGGSLVNINTVTPFVLHIWTAGIAKKLGIPDTYAESVTTKILQLRMNNGYFKDKLEIDVPLSAAEEITLFNVLMNNVTLQSQYFLIEVTGNSSKIKRKMEAIYSRKDKRILDGHES